VSQPDIFQDKKERNDFYIALGVIALVGLFLWFYIFGMNTSASLDIVDDQATEATTEIPDAPHIYESEEPLEEVESEIVETSKASAMTKMDVADKGDGDYIDLNDVVEETKEEMSETGDKMEEVVGEIKEEASEFVEETKDVAEEVKDKVVEMADAAQEEVAEVVDEVVDEVKQVAPVVQSSSSTNTSTSDICHISVGLYKDQVNIDKVLNRLKLSGFDVYTKPFPRSTQVGVYVTCERSEALSVLSEIQSDFARDAFIEEFK